MSSERYIPDSAYLKNIVCAIWQVKHDTLFQEEVIIPKGVVEIIFDLGDNAPIQSRIVTRNFQLPKCFINGFNTEPIQLQLPRHHFFFGVQFHPVAIKAIFGAPANEFSNITVDLTLISPMFDSLWDQLAAAETFNQRVSIITHWLEGKLVGMQSRDLLMSSFFESHNPDVSLKRLSETLCYSPRHISRKITELTGMNTEQFLLYRKYLHAVHQMHQSDLSLTDIGYRSSFSDQSHFIRTFKVFAKMTPKEYRQNKGYVPGHLNKNVR